MRKGTKKNIIHGILIIFVINFALMASFVAAFRDISVQSMIARSAAGELSRKLNTEVKIKTFYITEKLHVCLEDVQINDLDGYPLFLIGTLNAKISPSILSGDIRVRDIYFKDVLGRIVKYENDEKLNIMDMVSYLGGGGKKDNKNANNEPFYFKVDNIKLDNGHVIYWNQNKDRPEKLSMDYAHIDIDSIYAEVSKFEIRADSVMGNVHTLSGKDRCGLPLDFAKGDVLFCEKCLNIDGLIIETNESRADLDLRFEYETSHAYDEFVDSVRIIGNIRPSTLLLSDLRYFAWILDRMPDKFNFTGFFDGTVRDFTVSNFDAYYGVNTHIEADVTFDGLPEFEDTYMDITIKNMVSNYHDLNSFAIPTETVTVPMPDVLESVGRFTTFGTFQGSMDNFKTNMSLLSDYGDIFADVYLNTTESSGYSFDIDANNLKIKELTGVDGVEEISCGLTMYGSGLTVEDTDFEADLNVLSLKLFGNEFKDFNIHGDFENQRLMSMTNISHPYIGLKLSSLLDLKGQKPSYNIIANIKNADLVNLHVMDNDSIMILSSDINLAFNGDDIDNITGNLSIGNTKYYNGESYRMNAFTASITEISGIKDVAIDCDFFDFYGTGIVSAHTFLNAMKNTARRYIDMPEWFGNSDYETDKQEFSLSLNLKDTRTLTKLFVPELYVSSGTTINASYTDGYAYHGSTIESPEIQYNNLKFKNIDIRNSAKFNEFVSNITLDDIIIRDTTSTNPDPISIENMAVVAIAGNNKLKIDLSWDDDDPNDHNKARFQSTFTPHLTSGGILDIDSQQILINDTLWQLDEDCRIDFQKHSIDIKNVDLYTKTQKISVHGVYPKHDSDTLYARFTDVDISDFDFITVGNDINFDGILNGYLGISGLNETLSFSSDIDLKDFYLNGKEVGDVTASAQWYEPKESIFVNMEIFNRYLGNDHHESAGLVGFYYPRKQRNNLKFDMVLDDFKLESLSPIMSGVTTRMNGYASGNVSINGSINEPVITGNLKLKEAGCKINYLNTYYTISNDIKLEKDKIVFDNIILRDTLGNMAALNGTINHNYLKDFNFDLDLTCDDFLALDIPAEQASGFYGTAVADGVLKVKGPINDINLDIDVMTKKGTEIDVPLSGTTTVDNNFIVFLNNNTESDTLVEDVEPEIVKNESNFSMNLLARVNSDAAVNIYLPQNMGSINARGNGNINIGLDNNDFELRGDYFITSGAFNFTLEMVKRTFTLREGGTLRWTGDPTDADINIIGVYRTKSSLASLGTQVVDSSALTNNINVDCIIRLSDKLMNPTITFGIELPNAKDDIKNTVYSVIDTTNQAIMAQQVFSLMVLGSFAYTAGSSIARLGTTAGYSMITNQLSNWLSQISKDFDIGINYTPNDQLTDEELEVALSTQLFDDRLIIEGNFGVIRGNKSDASNANNIVGDVDLTFKLTKRLSLKAYNHTNIHNTYYIYSFENYSDFTQGVGISFSQSFDNIREVFTINNKKNKPKLTNGNTKPE